VGGSPCRGRVSEAGVDEDVTKDVDIHRAPRVRREDVYTEHDAGRSQAGERLAVTTSRGH
jgi:hypothetical protein